MDKTVVRAVIKTPLWLLRYWFTRNILWYYGLIKYLGTNVPELLLMQ